MPFRMNTTADKQNNEAIRYLADNLSDPDAGRSQVEALIEELGNVVDSHPDWHPLITAAQGVMPGTEGYTSPDSMYPGMDHTRYFVRGFVTCPYDDTAADRLVAFVDGSEHEPFYGISARRLDAPLYSDKAYPVAVWADEIELADDGTVKSRQALRLFLKETAQWAQHAQVAETWWNMRHALLGAPRGSRSSLFVDQVTGGHMRKILEAMNDSGLFGPIKESSLEMLSRKKRDQISDTLIRATVDAWTQAGKPKEKFSFELRDETCEGKVRDTWEDNHELIIDFRIGGYDLHTTGFHYPGKDIWQPGEPKGKRKLAEKFA